MEKRKLCSKFVICIANGQSMSETDIVETEGFGGWYCGFAPPISCPYQIADENNNYF